MKIKILVAHHKNGYIYNDIIHEPIHVGSELSKVNLDILQDNLGNNISHLNQFYCEMTATYWAWKNISSDYIGICHYRRYFFNKKNCVISKKDFKYSLLKIKSLLFKDYKGSFFKNQITIKNNNKTKFISQFTMWLSDHVNSSNTDIYALKPVIHFNNTNFHFFSELGVDYLKQLKNIVKLSHNEYYYSLNLTLTSNKLHYANMIIMKSEYFSEYCDFVFDVLKQHVELNDKTMLNNDSYLRIPGYMAELLTSTFILNKQLKGHKIKYLDNLFIED